MRADATRLLTLPDCPISHSYDCRLKTTYNVSPLHRRGARWNPSVDRRHQRYPLPTTANIVPLEDVGVQRRRRTCLATETSGTPYVHLYTSRRCVLGKQSKHWLKRRNASYCFVKISLEMYVSLLPSKIYRTLVCSKIININMCDMIFFITNKGNYFNQFL